MIYQTAATEANPPPENRERSRLLDHFKRVFAILVGLAITEACKKFLPVAPRFALPGPTFWMFVTLLLIIIPIFQGGERSLDVRHLNAAPIRRWFFMWDVYVLLITALLFVCAAEALPHPDVSAKTKRDAVEFYIWLSIFFGFDVFALIVDYLKSGELRERLRSYGTWIALNFAMAVVCVGAAALIRGRADILFVSMAICVCAALRSFIDYATSEATFMFP